MRGGRVPALGGGRAKEGPAPNGAEAGRGNSEVDGGGSGKEWQCGGGQTDMEVL